MFAEETMRRLARTAAEADSRSFPNHALGRVSVYSAEKIVTQGEDLLHSTIQNATAETVVLDCAQMDSMDSSRLGVLVTVARYATARGTLLKLMNLRPEVCAVLKDNNLFAVFEICPPREVLMLWCLAVCRTPDPYSGCSQDRQ